MTKNNEQIRHPLYLKSEEDLNEKIIKEKGNTKCIFYADDICRNGDKTRDCVNCARVEYHSLYSLNWDNQERLQKIIKHKEQECEKLKEELESAKGLVTVGNKQLAEALLELQKFKDKEQREIELNKLRADGFKEMQHDLYKKFEGNSLIEKRNPYGN